MDGTAEQKNNILKLGNFFFRNRSYLPLPFLILSVIFMEPTPASMIAGFCIGLAGEAIRLWSVSYAGSETRTTSGVGGTYLVTQGPYSIVRNPLYMGNILIYTGVGVMSMALFPWLQLAGLLFFSFQYYCIIRTEEKYLHEKFGKNYLTFLKSVNRFLPSFRTIPEEIRSGLSFSFEAGSKSEKRSIQALAMSALVIFIGYLIQNRLIP